MNKILTSKQRIEALALLGGFMSIPDVGLNELISSARQYNAWFTPESTAKAVAGIASMLNREDLEKWMETGKYVLDTEGQPMLSVGLILAGNIPLVGFHDIICVLAAGHKALIKLSSHDKKLIPYLLGKLCEIEPSFSSQIEYVERLKGFDAVIATGSNNTSRYFEYYFSSVPHIIRKNRNSLAVLSGEESHEDLHALGNDIFDYFGLGCRNVSKIYVPDGYDFKKFFESIEDFNSVGDHHKYRNNYDYNKSIFLVNMDKHLDNGFLLLKKDQRLASPLAVLYYEEYNDLSQVRQELSEKSEEIQCIVSSIPLNAKVIRFGESQHPSLWDYADNIDTMAFLLSLNK